MSARKVELPLRLQDCGWEIWDHNDRLVVHWNDQVVDKFPYIPGSLEAYMIVASLAIGFVRGAVWQRDELRV
jgi:hypothetical protein